jgi:hypothetical protein
MSDWVKVLIGALAGMVAGLVAEPLKQQLTLIVESQRIRSALRQELSLIYLSFCNNSMVKDYEWELKNFEDNLRFVTADKFLYYIDKKPEACYRLQGWSFTKSFFERYLEIRERSLKGLLTPAQTCKEIRFEYFEHTHYGPKGLLLKTVEDSFAKKGYQKLKVEDVVLSRYPRSPPAPRKSLPRTQAGLGPYTDIALRPQIELGPRVRSSR